MRDLLFKKTAWDDYLHWQNHDKKISGRINKLLQDIERNGYKCIGKPEPLKHDFSGWWSVRIDECNRIVFRVRGDTIEIAQCGAHYRD